MRQITGFSGARTTVFGSLLVLSTLLAGCFTPSLHPLYTQKDLVAVPGIAGMWLATNDKPATWKFYAKPGGKAYTVIVNDGKSPAVLDAHFLRLGSHLYMDTTPGECIETHKECRFQNLTFVCHLVGAHIFWRVDMRDDDMKLDVLDYEDMETALKEKQITLKHEVVKGEKEEDDDTILLTASTEELQAFMIASGDAFFSGYPLELKRKKVVAARK